MKLFCPILLFLVSIGLFTQKVNAQGDQILDGIGETGMVARYVFDGDTKDWSRNNLHGKFHGGVAKYVKDERFGQVLSLSGGANDYISIPGTAFTDLESISISGWVYLQSNKTNQYFF